MFLYNRRFKNTQIHKNRCIFTCPKGYLGISENNNNGAGVRLTVVWWSENNTKLWVIWGSNNMTLNLQIFICSHIMKLRFLITEFPQRLRSQALPSDLAGPLCPPWTLQRWLGRWGGGGMRPAPRWNAPRTWSPGGEVLLYKVLTVTSGKSPNLFELPFSAVWLEKMITASQDFCEDERGQPWDGTSA